MPVGWIGETVTSKTFAALVTLADHAEAWQRERGEDVPKKGTPEYTSMYEEWAEWAFSDLHH